MTAISIKSKLKELGKNQAWLAEKLGISCSRLSIIINGHTGENNTVFAKIDRILAKEESKPTPEFLSIKLRVQLRKIGKTAEWLAMEANIPIEFINEILDVSPTSKNLPIRTAFEDIYSITDVIHKERKRLLSLASTFSPRLKKIGKRQQWLAKQTGISPSMLSTIFNGRMKEVNDEVLVKIDDILTKEYQRIYRLIYDK